MRIIRVTRPLFGLDYYCDSACSSDRTVFVLIRPQMLILKFFSLGERVVGC